MLNINSLPALKKKQIPSTPIPIFKQKILKKILLVEKCKLPPFLGNPLEKFTLACRQVAASVEAVL